MRGKGPKPEAIQHLVENPEELHWNDLILAKHLVNRGFYSKKTYLRDIRIRRLKEAAWYEISRRGEVQGTTR